MDVWHRKNRFLCLAITPYTGVMVNLHSVFSCITAMGTSPSRVSLLATLLLSATLGFGQTSLATVTGTITDATGAVLTATASRGASAKASVVVVVRVRSMLFGIRIIRNAPRILGLMAARNVG